MGFPPYNWPKSSLSSALGRAQSRSLLRPSRCEVRREGEDPLPLHQQAHVVVHVTVLRRLNLEVSGG